jgi:hypothetical protein
VLCHAPNSAPPERAFSALNDSIGDGQYNAKANYKKVLMQLQYNNRGRGDKNVTEKREVLESKGLCPPPVASRPQEEGHFPGWRLVIS